MFLSDKDRLRAILHNDMTEIRMLMMHPMQEEQTLHSATIEADYIQTIDCWRNDEQMIEIHCGPATSDNPFFAFHLAGGQVGDVIKVRWVDNQGRKGVIDTRVR